MDANTIAVIVFVLIVLIVLIFAGIEIGTFDVIRDTVYDLFHPDPGPDLVLKPMEIRARRCQECNSIITGLDIVIVKDDAKPVGFAETELYEAIYCKHCGHQNIIGKYYRHANDDINLKAQIARKDTKKHVNWEFVNDIDRVMQSLIMPLELRGFTYTLPNKEGEI